MGFCISRHLCFTAVEKYFIYPIENDSSLCVLHYIYEMPMLYARFHSSIFILFLSLYMLEVL